MALEGELRTDAPDYTESWQEYMNYVSEITAKNQISSQSPLILYILVSRLKVNSENKGKKERGLSFSLIHSTLVNPCCITRCVPPPYSHIILTRIIDGGPIIAVQVENEYYSNSSGTYDLKRTNYVAQVRQNVPPTQLYRHTH